MKKPPVFPPLAVLVLAVCLASCAKTGRAAVIWTDRPEFAVYAGYFNAAQNQYKVEVRCFDDPAARLIRNRKQNGKDIPFLRAANESGPDIVAASWLKNTSSRVLFRPLESFLGGGRIPEEQFYPPLLSLGKIDGRQYFLPVSFNIPAVVFARENAGLPAGNFTTRLEELRTKGKAYNVSPANGASWSRVGFSPSWSNDFLFITATLFNTGFREADGLVWDREALENSIRYIRNWIEDANAGMALEDDFYFKYFFVPPIRLVQSGRILFTSIDSADLFVLGEELRGALDFRWLAGDADEIPVAENSTWYGICRDGRAYQAAAAFTRWFFRDDTQRFLLEETKRLRMGENTFGIAGGFSALRSVTEHIFPHFYPALLGHMPPAESLRAPDILPRRWMALKTRVILPWLREQIRAETPPSSRALEQRIANWIRLNPE
ncbi:MAG: hypothetical protein LBC88_10075 [Spirochaetaceae bacterium]|jgi:hypothetical protein|nr:hypothetical protein [Spirochaetaceae bacterium]